MCRGAAGATDCKDWSDRNAVTFPGACWNWTDCFKRCCDDPNGPVGGVNGWIPVKVCSEKSNSTETNSTCTCEDGSVPVDAQCTLDGTCGDGITPLVNVTSTMYDPDYPNYETMSPSPTYAPSTPTSTPPPYSSSPSPYPSPQSFRRKV